jgi:putative ABC transporter related protein
MHVRVASSRIEVFVRQDGHMLEGALILVLTVVLVLVVAGGVVAVLALSRRSADEWKGVIKRESEEIAVEVKTNHSLPKRAATLPDGPVVPRTASLQSLLQGAESKSAYFDADRLPGIDRLETVTDRVSVRFDRGRRSADGGGESVQDSPQS